jgi:hypothetical protein
MKYLEPKGSQDCATIFKITVKSKAYSQSCGEKTENTTNQPGFEWFELVLAVERTHNTLESSSFCLRYFYQVVFIDPQAHSIGRQINMRERGLKEGIKAFKIDSLMSMHHSLWTQF